MNDQSPPVRKVAKVKSADRALEVIEILVHAPHGLTHSELAAALNIPKSSLTKMLRSLMASGHVQRADGLTYQVGARWRSLVKASITGSSIDFLVQPSLEHLVKVTGETAGFNMIVGDQIETISTVASNHQLQFTMIRGERSPVHRMSSGQAILAHMEPDFQARYHQQILSTDPGSSLRKKDAFERAMQDIRENGFAEVSGFRDGIIGLAAPILAADGNPLASINVATPEIRLTAEARTNTIAILKNVSADLGGRLDGWIDSPEDWLGQ